MTVDQSFLNSRNLQADAAALQQDPAGWFAQLVVDHHRHLVAGEPGRVIRLDDHRPSNMAPARAGRRAEGGDAE